MGHLPFFQPLLIPILLDGFSTNFLAATLARKRLFDTLLLAWFQVKGVFFNFLDDVFLLNLPLEAPQSVFNRLAVLNSNLCQSVHPQSGCDRPMIITYFDRLWRRVHCVLSVLESGIAPQKTSRFVPYAAAQSGKSRSIALRPAPILKRAVPTS